MIAPFSRLSLLWKILLSTSVAITLLFALTGWIVLRNAVQTTASTMEDEVGASFQAYQSLWEARADLLSSVSLTLSQMSDVRSVFGTGDEATIRDTAERIVEAGSGDQERHFPGDRRARQGDRIGGWIARRREQDVQCGGAPLPATSVRVPGARRAPLPNGLHAGLSGERAAKRAGGRLRVDAAGSQTTEGRYRRQRVSVRFRRDSPIASSLDPEAARRVASALAGASRPGAGERRRHRSTPRGPRSCWISKASPSANLWILRSFATASERLAALRRNIILLWLLAVAASLGLTYVLARRIVEPVKELDRAAAEVARQNYEHRVKVVSQDELGRLARTFNAMCASIQQARQELIRQERISTIGRLSSSIVHDLRNPLAAVYGGAEMLVDTELTSAAGEAAGRQYLSRVAPHSGIVAGPAERVARQRPAARKCAGYGK